jgi:hypothetical protein
MTKEIIVTIASRLLWVAGCHKRQQKSAATQKHTELFSSSRCVQSSVPLHLFNTVSRWKVQLALAGCIAALVFHVVAYFASRRPVL